MVLVAINPNRKGEPMLPNMNPLTVMFQTVGDAIAVGLSAVAEAAGYGDAPVLLTSTIVTMADAEGTQQPMPEGSSVTFADPSGLSVVIDGYALLDFVLDVESKVSAGDIGQGQIKDSLADCYGEALIRAEVASFDADVARGDNLNL